MMKYQFEIYHLYDDSGARSCDPLGWFVGHSNILSRATARAARYNGGYVRRVADGAVWYPQPWGGKWIDGELVHGPISAADPA